MSNEEIKLPPLPEPDVIAYTCIGDNDAYSPMRVRAFVHAAILADRAECAHRIAGEPDGTDGVAGLHPYGFHVQGVYMRWYLKREVDALFAARPVADIPSQVRDAGEGTINKRSAVDDVRCWMGDNDVVLSNKAYTELVKLVKFYMDGAAPSARTLPKCAAYGYIGESGFDPNDGHKQLIGVSVQPSGAHMKPREVKLYTEQQVLALLASGTPAEAPSVRDQALEEAAQECISWGDELVLKWQNDEEMFNNAKARAWDGVQLAARIRALQGKPEAASNRLCIIGSSSRTARICENCDTPDYCSKFSRCKNNSVQ